VSSSVVCRLPKDELPPTSKKKQKRKMKIKDGIAGSGKRTLFDTSGRALDPLEALQSSREACPIHT
jgi:hypothetical protein